MSKNRIDTHFSLCPLLIYNGLKKSTNTAFTQRIQQKELYQLTKVHWKNLLLQRADPCSSYSALVAHIVSKSGLDARSEPPRQTPNTGLEKKNDVRQVS